MELESIIPGLSLLLNTRGLSIAPVATITLSALIFHNLCLMPPFFLSNGRWSEIFSFAKR